MKTTIFIAGIILSTFLISCGQDINPEEIFKKEIEFKLTILSKINNSFDTLTFKRIPRDSEIIVKLKDWLTKNPDGWKSSIASWATSEISLTGNDFRLLIFDHGIVIGFTDKNGKARQYTKQVEKKEFNFLTENK
jgi:hypothetical protein